MLSQREVNKKRFSWNFLLVLVNASFRSGHVFPTKSMCVNNTLVREQCNNACWVSHSIDCCMEWQRNKVIHHCAVTVFRRRKHCLKIVFNETCWQFRSIVFGSGASADILKMLHIFQYRHVDRSIESIDYERHAYFAPRWQAHLGHNDIYKHCSSV